MFDKLLSGLLSMRLMAFLILLFFVAIGYATFIENDFGTQTAKALVYNATWFEIIIVVGIAIIVLGPKDFPVMLKKAGSWIGTAKRYVNNIQNEVSNIDVDIDDEKNNEIKKENKENE